VGPVAKCFSSAAVGELPCFDETFASRLFNLAGAFALDGLGPAGALGFFELLGSTASFGFGVFV
jgi:hypothetical protein